MRFKKGNKVEVMNRNEIPVSWRSGEILSGNGHTYRVKVDAYPGATSKQMVETVSWRLMRPCPPLMLGVDSCSIGDIVEVFFGDSWKIAVILKVLGGKGENIRSRNHLQDPATHNHYLVRLLGCSEELVIDRSSIRMRQTWLDGKWILMGKSSQGDDDVLASKPSTSYSSQKINYEIPQFNVRAEKKPKKHCMNIQDDATYGRSPMNSFRSLKRMSPYASTVIEAHNGRLQKMRRFEKNGKKQGMVVLPVLEKVDAVAYPREFLGGKNMHTSFKIISNGYTQMEIAKVNEGFGCSGVRSSDINSSDSDACSVGSCSVASQSPTNYIHFIAPREDSDTLCSDAESCYVSGSERKTNFVPPKGGVEVSIHRLELHAYRSTLEALHASGPLSWEQEALLTNLRIMLHISNDEHLIELKHLISAKTAIGVR